MTRVHFYELEGGLEAALRLCCRLAAKAMAQGLDTLIHSGDRETLERLDQLLWEQPPAACVCSRQQPRVAATCPPTQ